MISKEDLIKYIEEAKSRGVSDNVIRTTLLYTHWTKEEISDAFKRYDDSRSFYDPNRIFATVGAHTRAVNFTSDGKAVAAKIEKRSRAAVIFLLLLIICGAIAAFWYIGYVNNVFVPVTAIPLPHIFDGSN
ncbi:MAG: hypothetical protein A3B25_02310 [Candidatus Ryanbacteria bacterium RIFCSPLOWO2_01_FULL_48_26]|uniref:Uncharacterized protein n=1 Tax=Candidatus Ryanbacteria bacterium RIFCSPLOWO2_01_FULL_48_26 TaxID=1802126 RepID=A0A1G2GUL2_9BACT|nr:MAG: hypothetical protein A3B25_02310 [Candidatus Ryanbacteria bacterium RIFCSPLOWO2_01_FULL_48_26]